MRGASHGVIGLFARHPTAANLLMIMMLLAGVISITRQNTQFFPDFSIEFVTVVVTWPGASATDVEANGAYRPHRHFAVVRMNDVREVHRRATRGQVSCRS